MDFTIEELLEVLEDVRPDIDFKSETKLVDDKILDSFDIITIVGELNETFDISIKAEKIKPENFNTLEAIEKLVTDLIG